MKPGDHPDFFRFPAPEGRSRESTIRLDADGRFWHDGSLIENPAMARAFFSWLRRHPDNGRYILSNGYDWTYLQVAGAPMFVNAVKVAGNALLLALADGTAEPLGRRVWTDSAGALWVWLSQRDLPARLSASAQAALGDVLGEDAGGYFLTSEGRCIRILSSPVQP